METQTETLLRVTANRMCRVGMDLSGNVECNQTGIYKGLCGAGVNKLYQACVAAQNLWKKGSNSIAA